MVNAIGNGEPTASSNAASAGRLQAIAVPFTKIVFFALCRRLQVQVRVVPSGTAPTLDGPTLVILNQRNFFRRIAGNPITGVAEAYVNGDWDTADLAGVLEPFAALLKRAASSVYGRAAARILARSPRLMANSVDKARENAAFHYDVPTGFFANFLDETYTYSSAMFDKDGDDTLADAQRRKIQTTLDRTGLRHGQSMLEIGCGWGTLSLEAARRGLDVVAISLARRQIDFARNRALAAGSSADFRVADYRSIDGTYDAAVSIEMIEAVGGEHIDEFFSAVSAALVPGGTFVLQFIYTSHARMVLSGRHDTWIRRNIFPGGQILSKELISSAAELAQFHVESSDEIGTDYARTLTQWADNLERSSHALHFEGVSDTVIRTWLYYFGMCAAAFRAGDLGCAQWTLRKANTAAPKIVRRAPSQHDAH